MYAIIETGGKQYKVAAGDVIRVEKLDVKEGDTLVVLEAMKMNNNLTAERDGIVKAILVKEGEAVKENTPLITFE